MQSPFGGARNANPFEHLFEKPSPAKTEQAMDTLMKSLRSEIYGQGGQPQFAAGPKNENAAGAARANGGTVNGQAGEIEPANGNSGPGATKPKKPDKSSAHVDAEGRKAARELERALARADALHALKATPKPVNASVASPEGTPARAGTLKPGS
ncbi:MAG: hypothetical protein HYY24_14710 [Verrucomicrobia bacterium]|nr:hypothetical protein [Verrucomicrobiota bacterium]